MTTPFNKTKIPRDFYVTCAKVLGAKYDDEGNFHVLREEITQDEVMKRYQDELANRSGIQRPSNHVSREELLTEGYIECFFCYDEVDYSDCLTEQTSKGGSRWNFEMPSWLKKKNHGGKPTEIKQPSEKVTKPKPSTVKTPRAGATKPAPMPTASPKAPSAPSTHIFHSPTLKMYVGHIHNQPFKPMDERGLYKHLLTKHGLSGSHAEQFLNRIKAGSTSGFEPVSASHHLDHAHRFAALALDHHYAGNEALRDKHLGLVGKHMDHATDLLTKHMKKRPGEFFGHNHPLHHQMSRIMGMMNQMDDDHK
jgi:hypothetical protein